MYSGPLMEVVCKVTVDCCSPSLIYEWEEQGKEINVISFQLAIGEHSKLVPTTVTKITTAKTGPGFANMRSVTYDSYWPHWAVGMKED